MLTYKKLPSATPRWLTVSILLLGGALGLSIATEGLIALYGLCGFLVPFFFPSSTFVIDANEAMYLGVLGVSAALSGTLVSYLAIHMNGLSRKALGMSRIAWMPLVTTGLLVLYHDLFGDFMYRFGPIWISGALASIVLGGILPYLLLRTPAARRLHKH